MKYKPEDLVVIPKSVLDDCLRWLTSHPASTGDTIREIRQAKPLKPIVEGIYQDIDIVLHLADDDIGRSDYPAKKAWDIVGEEKQEFLEKGVDI